MGSIKCAKKVLFQELWQVQQVDQDMYLYEAIWVKKVYLSSHTKVTFLHISAKGVPDYICFCHLDQLLSPILCKYRYILLLNTAICGPIYIILLNPAILWINAYIIVLQSTSCFVVKHFIFNKYHKWNVTHKKFEV